MCVWQMAVILRLSGTSTRVLVQNTHTFMCGTLIHSYNTLIHSVSVSVSVSLSLCLRLSLCLSRLKKKKIVIIHPAHSRAREGERGAKLWVRERRLADTGCAKSTHPGRFRPIKKSVFGNGTDHLAAQRAWNDGVGKGWRVAVGGRDAKKRSISSMRM